MTAPSTTAIQVRNPLTGAKDFELVPPTGDQLHGIVERLRRNQVAWGAATVEHRVEVLRHWADELDKRFDDIVAVESIDWGHRKPSVGGMAFTLANLRGWCERAEPTLRALGRQGRSERMPSVSFRTQLVPYPLLGVISPWNGPVTLSLVDATPALFAGCAVIVKPSEVAPRFIEPLMESIRQVPELEGVLHYVGGDGQTGQALIEEVDIVCFTGSVATGRKVAQACARRFIPVFLELGGKDPAVVTASANVEQAATAILRGGVFLAGQSCASVERVYVHADIHDEFVATLTRLAGEVRINYPVHEEGDIGPFTFEPQAAIVDSHLDDAIAKGAVLHTGGKSENLGGGLFMRPVVLSEVNHDMRIMREETFGPVLPVMRYHREEEAIALANDTIFGLSASVFAGTTEEAARIGEQINAGEVVLQDALFTMIGVWECGSNPFGYSGLGGGVRGGPEGIRRFLRTKAILTNSGIPQPL